MRLCRRVVTAALEQNGEALQFASRDLQHDIDVVTAAFYNTDPEEVIKHVPAAVRGNRSHVLSFINNLITIDHDWLELLFAVPSLRDVHYVPHYLLDMCSRPPH